MKRIALIAAAACIVLAGCSKEDPAAPQTGGPIRLNAAMDDRPEVFSRATTDNRWSGGEQIAVNIRGEVKKYVADAQGKLTAAESEIPFYWQTEQEQVRAWCFGTYLSAEPESVTVEADQSGAGYAGSDFLFASGTVDQSNPALVFSHKTVKVVVMIRDEGRTVQGVKLGDENLALTGVWNKTTEQIEPARYGPGTITPHALTPGEGYAASYAALLVPQDVSKKEFIRVTVDDDIEYSHKPEAGKGKLEAGRQYTYHVSLRDGIWAELVSAGDWIADGTEDVRVDVLKAGDYLYADGSWSDGGLRGRQADGSLIWATPKPAPTAGKKVIGIVFQTDPSRISAAEKALFAAKGKKLHGVAMAVKHASAYSSWYDNYNLSSPDNYTRDESVEDPAYPGYVLPNNFDTRDYKKSYQLADADINGYFNTLVIKERRADDLKAAMYPAFKATVDFAKKAGGPDADVFTTGWYLPSPGQWFDFFRNVAGLNLGTDNLNKGSGGDFSWEDTGNLPAVLNETISLIPATDKTEYEANGLRFWTSSAVSASQALVVDFVYAPPFENVTCTWDRKNNSLQAVRCAIAF